MVQFFLVTASTKRKYSMLHSLTFLHFDFLEVSPDAHEEG